MSENRKDPLVDGPEELSPEEWVKSFRRWVESHRDVPHPVDDSRESIYEGRGE
jgi:hypothetical protein